jgi:LPS O-antigen subunit length determinant protein (WzzB/FepE family)
MLNLSHSGTSFPSMPVKKDGPGKALIVVLAALLGAVCLR